MYVNATLSTCPTLYFPTVSTPVSHVCISISTLQISSSIPFSSLCILIYGLEGWEPGSTVCHRQWRLLVNLNPLLETLVSEHTPGRVEVQIVYPPGADRCYGPIPFNASPYLLSSFMYPGVEGRNKE